MTTVMEQREEKQILKQPASGSQPGLWARVCATAGAVAWAGVAVAARAGVAKIGAIELMFLFGPLVIVPLGMELGRRIAPEGWSGEIARWLQPLGAALASASMCVGPGRMAGGLACGWLVVCGLMGGAGVIEFAAKWRTKSSNLWTDATLAIARVDLVVGAAWLVASRWGMRPMGIQEPIGLLTAVHFHFAGFATATIAAATLGRGDGLRTNGWRRGLLVLVAGMPFVVAAGFVISPVLKMVAGIVFSASVAAVAIVLRGRGREAKHTTARVLLQVAAVAVFAGMVLSSAYAVADYFGSDILPIPEMARTHGVLNAVGFCMAGLLGWLVEGL